MYGVSFCFQELFRVFSGSVVFGFFVLLLLGVFCWVFFEAFCLYHDYSTHELPVPLLGG